MTNSLLIYQSGTDLTVFLIPETCRFHDILLESDGLVMSVSDDDYSAECVAFAELVDCAAVTDEEINADVAELASYRHDINTPFSAQRIVTISWEL